MSKYETIIGLEIHTQLKTKSKMFCGCANNPDSKPNSNICHVCLGHPGTLPYTNSKAIEWTIMCGLALGCQIGTEKEVKSYGSSKGKPLTFVSKFDRKNYFYPDLPKGYQISQYDEPLCRKGSLEIKVRNQAKKIGIERIHLEEDAGKLVHPKGKKESLVDFNRAGTPLMEIVTRPDLRSSLEAKIFLQELRKLLRYMDISDADMERGQLRCDANISLRKSGDWKLSPKTEIKNMNSFRALERALDFEVRHQKNLWEEENPPKFQSTRAWNDEAGETREMRTKEEAQDYRYFAEPDLPLFEFSPSYLRKLSDALPELPWEKKKRFIKEFSLDEKEAETITSDRITAEFFEHALSEAEEWCASTEGKTELSEKKFKEIVKLTASWLSSKLFALLNNAKQEMSFCKITPENFAELVIMLYEGKVNSRVGLEVLAEMFKTGADPSQFVEKEGLSQVSDKKELEEICASVIAENPKPVADFKKGKGNALQFLLGRVMAKTRGKANPKIVAELLKKKLS
jgi:aspartyl-tRNA(Asn)/glutamyl-tRNA(Gln) amidotransferase subunit B